MYKKRKELSSVLCMIGMPDDARNIRHSPYPATKYINEFYGMTLGERAHIVRLGELKSFKPDTEPPSKKFKEKYSKEWWDKNISFECNGSLNNGDTYRFITNLCLFQDRCQREWRPPVITPTDFYTPITYENALGWYESCPLHLRVKLEKEIAKYPEAEKATPREELYKKVRRLWGDRPNVVYHDNELLSSYEEYEINDEWCHEYDKQVAIEVILTHGAAIQQERKMLNEAMGITQDGNGFPMQSDGLDPTQAATIRWLQQQGQTPLEFLADTYKDSEARLGDRITAARTLMEYIHRKVPQKTEIDTKDISSPKLDPKTLKGLSENELKTLETLLKKLGDGNG